MSAREVFKTIERFSDYYIGGVPLHRSIGSKEFWKEFWTEQTTSSCTKGTKEAIPSKIKSPAWKGRAYRQTRYINELVDLEKEKEKNRLINDFTNIFKSLKWSPFSRFNLKFCGKFLCELEEIEKEDSNTSDNDKNDNNLGDWSVSGVVCEAVRWN